MDDFINQLIAGDFLHIAIAAAAVGLLVFGIIEFVDRLVSHDRTQPGLTPQVKFWSAIVLSFIVPIAAYIVQSVQTGVHPSLTGLFLACAVGYVASQAVHWGTGGSQTATALHEASLHPQVPVKIAGSDKHVTIR